MKRSLLAVTVVALFALLIAPAAMAKPGNGNGNGKKSDSSVQTTSNSGSCDWNCSPPPPDCDWDHSCPPPPDCDWDNSCPPPCDWKCPPPCHPDCPPPPPIDCTDAFADPNILWPPNHKFHLVTVVVPGADDVRVTGVTQDESTEALGDGNFAPDATLAGHGQVNIRSERSGLGDGRVYEISFDVFNSDHDFVCDGTVTVGVPHDQGNPNKKKGGRIPRDSGQNFNSLG